MTHIPKNPTEVLAMALRNEERGREILLDGERSAKSPLAKATFEFLANEELEHIRLIQEFARSLETGGDWRPGELKPVSKRKAGEHVKSIFDKYAAEFQKVGERGEERMDIYEAALQMERDGHHYYAHAAEQAEDERARSLYEFLAKEETRHFELIQDTRDFLDLPDALLAVEERWMTV